MQATLIGCAAHPSYWGKGIATRAVKMVSNTTFDEWPHLDRLEAFSEVDNLASQKVLLIAEGWIQGRCSPKVFYYPGKSYRWCHL